MARDFQRRNRIITGLSEGAVVIEAAERSGHLISARTALEQNREVMAVLGSPLEPRASGNNRLLREGATLVRNTADVIEALDLPQTRVVRTPDKSDYSNPDEVHDALSESQIVAVRAVLGPSPISLTEIARSAGISVSRCAAILVESELSGVAVTYSGGLAGLTI